ncbi:hypothetical protein [Marinobacterium sp. BA1]|uniref:hypothetical protein n=1 Tax=Marinobacterium sp. BA1 TaxID=3138931 RepID=UPI0032E68EAC
METILLNTALLIYFLLLLWFARQKGLHILHAGIAVLSVPVAVWLGFKGDQFSMWLVLAMGAGGVALALEGPMKRRKKYQAEAACFDE